MPRLYQRRGSESQRYSLTARVERLEDVMSDLDVLYMTRVQKERFFNEEDYVRHERFLYSGQAENGTGKR
ncbi:MAG: hypothetical protein ACLVEO_11915 [Lachnospiraceae bacterium]